jgi:hypothetical protein
VNGLDAESVREIRAVIDAMAAFLRSVPTVYGPAECEDLIKLQLPRWIESLRGALIPPTPGGYRPDPPRRSG